MKHAVTVCKLKLVNEFFEVRHPRCVSNKSKCNVYTICRHTQLSIRWYAKLTKRKSQLHVSATEFGHHQVV